MLSPASTISQASTIIQAFTYRPCTSVRCGSMPLAAWWAWVTWWSMEWWCARGGRGRPRPSQAASLTSATAWYDTCWEVTGIIETINYDFSSVYNSLSQSLSCEGVVRLSVHTRQWVLPQPDVKLIGCSGFRNILLLRFYRYKPLS